MSKTPKSIEEALQGRPGTEPIGDMEEAISRIQSKMGVPLTGVDQEPTDEELTAMIPGPTLDETIQAARREAQLQAKLMDPTLESAPIQNPIPTVTTNTTTSPTLTSPVQEAALTESPQSVATDSIQASVEAIRLLDPRPNQWPVDVVRLAEYLAGPDFTINWVESQIRVLSTVPDIVPSPNQWKLPAEVDLPKLVFDIIRTPGWLSREWPSLRVLMGGPIGNIQWAAKVLVTLSIFQAVNLVGMFDGQKC